MEAPRVRGLGDMRTVTTHHITSKPPRKGTTFLDLFALSMERNRLEQELAGIERRRNRILTRLAEVQETMDGLVVKGEQEKVDHVSPEPGRARPKAASRPPTRTGPWRRVPLEY